VTVKELYNKLGKLMEDTPNTTDDEIYYYSYEDEVVSLEGISIEFDLNSEGRYIIIK
jgi:hypothetical protein